MEWPLPPRKTWGYDKAKDLLMNFRFDVNDNTYLKERPVEPWNVLLPFASRRGKDHSPADMLDRRPQPGANSPIVSIY